jgi:hypothetical protein
VARSRCPFRWNGVTAPKLLAGFGVPAVDEAADAELGPGNAGDEHAVGYQRCNRERKAVLPFRRLRLPQLLAVFGVIRDHVGIERGAKDLAVVDRRALVGDAAADDARGLRRPIQHLLPDLPAGGDVDRHSRLGISNVHHAVVDDRLRLLAPTVVEAETPHRHQALDGLLVDLVERAVALLVIAHAIRENVVGRAAVAVFLKVVERLRGDASAEQHQNTRSRYEGLHERRSLISRSWRRTRGRLHRPVAKENNEFAPTVESLEDGDGMDCRCPTGTSAVAPISTCSPSPTITVARRRQQSPDFENRFRAPAPAERSQL